MGRIDPAEVLTRAARGPDQVIRYGPGPEQVADLRIPPGWGGQRAGRGGPGVLILLLHGGFWRAAYDRTHTGPMAAALAGAGYLVCAPEFRRVGPPGGRGAGGWPGTFDDVAAAIDALPGLVESAVPGPSGGWRVVLAGHSAGGHLALWAAARPRLGPGQPWHAGQDPWIAGVVALAPVSDLAACYRGRLGNNAAGDLLGGGPEERSGRYAATDPASLLPLGVPVRIVHGSDDGTVPAGMSHRFAAQARAAGDDVELSELAGAGHFDVIDPLSPAWPAVLAAFRSVGPVGAVPGPGAPAGG
jgi:acetyl esterase/lipase